MEIFSFLPPADLAQARLVCGEWKKMANDKWNEYLSYFKQNKPKWDEERRKEEERRRKLEEEERRKKEKERELLAQLIITSRDVSDLLDLTRNQVTRNLLEMDELKLSQQEKRYLNYPSGINRITNHRFANGMQILDSTMKDMASIWKTMESNGMLKPSKLDQMAKSIAKEVTSRRSVKMNTWLFSR
jgi:hypothetical protein